MYSSDKTVAYQLLSQRNLVELQLVDLGGSAGQQRRRQQRGELHGGTGSTIKSKKATEE